MVKKQIFIAVLVLSLATMACGVRFNLPITDYKTGPTREESLSVPIPESTDGHPGLELDFAAGELRLAPGGNQTLVSGTATYNVADLKPTITTRSNRTIISTGDLELHGVPEFGDDLENTWNLTLGDTPMDLMISSGAYKGRMELGGLSLRSLEITDGAADVQVSFSEPNLVEMDSLRYETGASKVELRSLANANFDSLVFKAGAGEYLLDFSGELLRNATVTIDAGFSKITLNVPSGTSARVIVDGGFSNVDIDSGWNKDGNVYTLEGTGASLTINVNLGAGSLELQSR